MGSDDIRSASKALLGNKYRAEIGACVHAWGDKPLTALAVADQTGIRYGRVHEELVRLKDAEMLDHVEQAGGSTVEYKASPSVYWRFCAELLAELEAGET
jgi:hypothetical protein